MKLSDLDVRGRQVNVVILQTPSTRLQLFLKDKLKLKYNCKADSIIDIDTKSDLKKIKEVIGVVPPFADRWFTSIDLDKLYDKELINLIKQSTTCCFMCTCSKYATFKKFKEDLKDVNGVFDFYINYLRRIDFLYLYDVFVLSDNKLSKQLFDYVSQSYGNDIDTIFDLLVHLNQGEQFNSRKDITSLCGIGGASVETFIFALLKDLSGSGKGLQITIKNRVKLGVDLADELGYQSLFNFMASSLKSFCEIKMLIISGQVYKEIRHLPKSFDEKALARNQKYIWRLKTIPLSDLLLLRQCMGSHSWQSEMNFLDFVYDYYKVRGLRECQLSQ